MTAVLPHINRVFEQKAATYATVPSLSCSFKGKGKLYKKTAFRYISVSDYYGDTIIIIIVSVLLDLF